MTTNPAPAPATPAAEPDGTTTVGNRLRIAVIAGSAFVAADFGYQLAQHHAPALIITTMVFSVLGNGAWMGNAVAAPKPRMVETARPKPLTLPEILVDTDGNAIPDEAFMPVIPEWDDDTLFIGHIARSEANHRLRARGVEYPHAGVPVVQGGVTHSWVLFEQHHGHCPEHAYTSHDHNPWHITHVSLVTPHAIPVTLAFADEEW